jgi:hypothetical protein
MPGTAKPFSALVMHQTLEDPMRKILLALTATAIMAVPLATVVKAEDTTIIKRDGDKKTVIKKEDHLNVLPVPHEEHRTTVIKKEHED